MNKIICYNCSNQIELIDVKEFSTIACPECQQELKIPKIMGEFILEETLSENRCYSTYKGKKAGSEEILVIKVLKDSVNFTDKLFNELEEKLSSVPDICRLKLLKSENSFTAFRPFYQTSIKDYLKNSRPQKEKAVYILKQTAILLDECAKQGISPADLMVGNLQMDDNGQLIISDLLFRESIEELLTLNTSSSILNPHCTSLTYLDKKEKDIRASLFSFGCLSYVLCCGTYPWPFGSHSLAKKARGILPEVILDLRDEKSEKLKSLIQTLIDEKSEQINSFQAVIDILDSKPASTPQKAGKPQKAGSKMKLAKSSGKKQIKTKRSKKKSNPLPLIVGIFLALIFIGVLFVKNGSPEKPVLAKVEKKVVLEKKVEPAKEIKKIITPKVLPKTESEPTPVEEVSAPVVKVEPVINRDAVKAELMPLDLNFDPIVDKLDEYIEATATNERELEEEKIEFVSTYRDHLLIHFYRKPYTGIFYLQNQKPFRGKVLKADESNIHIVMLNSKKPMVISWKDFEFNQLHEFADYYGATYTEEFSLSDNNDEIFKKVAQEYSKLAVVLDWYGFKEQAVNYKKKSIKLDASLLTKLDMLIKEEPTN